MSDSNIKLPLDAKELHSLLVRLQDVQRLNKIIEDLRAENDDLIETKQQLEGTKEQKGIGLHFDKWFFLIGKVRQWSDDYLAVDYSSGTIEFECQSPDDLYKKDMVIAVLEYKDDGWVAMFVEELR